MPEPSVHNVGAPNLFFPMCAESASPDCVRRERATGAWPDGVRVCLCLCVYVGIQCAGGAPKPPQPQSASDHVRVQSA